jgi:hypothetical protein
MASHSAELILQISTPSLSKSLTQHSQWVYTLANEVYYAFVKRLACRFLPKTKNGSSYDKAEPNRATEVFFQFTAGATEMGTTIEVDNMFPAKCSTRGGLADSTTPLLRHPSMNFSEAASPPLT